jgi:hypothetical protein
MAALLLSGHGYPLQKAGYVATGGRRAVYRIHRSGRSLAKELGETFETDLKHCIEFDPAEYRKNNTRIHFRASVARLPSPPC